MKKLQFKSIYLFNTLAFFLMGLTVFMYLQFQDAKQFVSEKLFQSDIIRVEGIVENIGKYYLNNFNDLNKKELYYEFSRYLNSFETNQYKNVFALQIIEDGKLVVIADGTSDLDDKLYQDEIFIPLNPKWQNCIKLKKPIYFYQDIDNLWITYLYPIIDNNKTFIIAIDLSTEDYRTILLKQMSLTKKISIFVVILILIIILSVILLYNDIQRKHRQKLIKIQKEKYLVQKLKHAQVGRIIDSVAHQWIQPLQAIKTVSELFAINLKSTKKLSDSEMIEYIHDIDGQADFALETLAEFRTFLSDNKSLELCTLSSIIHSSKIILDDVLVYNKIDVLIVGDVEAEVNIYKNEFKHVIINLIQNTKDAFIKNNIENRKISFKIIKENNNVILKVQDNAGGISDDIIKDIFNINVSTKDYNCTETHGIGLYMTKNILNKIDATITVRNNNGGAIFEIRI